MGGDDLISVVTNGPVQLVGITLNGGQGNDTLTADTMQRAITLLGNEGNDSAIGGTSNDVLEGGAGNDSLQGGNGHDRYVFDADAALGTDTIIEAASGGTDTLDFTTTTAQTIALDLANDGLQSINAFLSIDLSPASQFENAKGGSQSNSITGNDRANNLTGGASADTLVGGLGNDTLVGLSGTDSLQGGAGDDSYTFDIDGPLGSDTIVETPTGAST